MKRIYLLLLCSLMVTVVTAQKAGFAPVTNEQGFRQQFAEASKKLTSIKADFIQEKKLSMLSETVKSTGSFYFKKEDKVRLEYKTPFTYLMVLNGSKVLIRDDAKTSKFDAGSSKIFKQVNNLMVNSIQGTILNSADFKAKVYESKGQYQVELTPVTKAFKDFFSTLNIIIDKKDYTVSCIEMNEVSGDSTVITFNNKQLNGQVGEDLFVVK